LPSVNPKGMKILDLLHIDKTNLITKFYLCRIHRERSVLKYLSKVMKANSIGITILSLAVKKTCVTSQNVYKSDIFILLRKTVKDERFELRRNRNQNSR